MRTLLIWVVLAVLMSLNGFMREYRLKRIMSSGAADLASAFSGIVLIVAATGVAFRDLLAASDGRALYMTSAVLVTLTLVFEVVVGRLGGRSWAELAGNYAFWKGRLWPLVLLVLALTPFMWGRWFQAHGGQ